MRLLSIGFLLGILIIQQFSSLPVLKSLQSLADFIGSMTLALLVCLLLTLLIASLRKYRFLIGLVAGLMHAFIVSTSVLEARISPALEGQDLLVSGSISSIPYQRTNGWKYRLNVESAQRLDQTGQPIRFKGVVRLGWYRDHHAIKAGEKWQMVVRLKQPSGFMNPGGFDYEKWLFEERIVATGYVRRSAKNKRLEQASTFSINSIREKIIHVIQDRIKKPELAAIVSALAVADRAAISEQQWEVLRNTGTNHLVAISGLHISMVAGFGFFPVFLIWWLFPRLYQMIPVRIAGGTLGAIFAMVYALLAGFTLPTQRALIMVLVVLIGLLARKHFSSSSVLATALLAVLLFDPLAVLSQGFWLSFVAVGLIMLTAWRRIQRQRFDILTIQFALSLGMLPLTLALFGTGSLSSPLANLLAIPWVTLVVLPLTLLSLLLLPLVGVSSVLLNLAATSVDAMFTVLNTLSFSQAVISIAGIPYYLLLITFLGFLWLWLPAKFPARWLGWVLMLPLITYKTERIEPGAFQFDLLDVGQGLASVVQTAQHVLVYDTGPRSSARFDTGKLVVLPFLRAMDIQRVDTLMISHEDLDHRGGAAAILSSKSVVVDKIISSDTSLFPDMENCNTGMKWTWDGVLFEILSPDIDWQESDNNRSCVLRVSNRYHSLLLTGDIQKKTENKLLESQQVVESEVMLVPHHGSNTSSQARFIGAVNATLALASAGYRNPFRQPHPKVLKRYQEKGVAVKTTIDNGAMRLRFPNTDNPYELQSYRVAQPHYWQRK